MGTQSVKAINTLKERKEFISHLLDDVEAFEIMLAQELFEKGIQRIGAEQELCLVKQNYSPSLNALKILEAIDDPHFTTELGLFNLEVNLDPLELKGTSFSKLEKNLNNLLQKAHDAAESIENNKIVLSGILPTLKQKDLVFENMTPLKRYKVLNDVIKKIKGENFKMRIMGVDELILDHESILFEACNTSFQVHLQIGLDQIIDKYNWSQVIAGPLLAVMSNSPLLLGHELWSETRIALFQQSIDIRNNSHLLIEQKPRVSFGNDWVRDSIVELFTDDIARYIPLVTTEFTEDSLAQLKKGTMPQLKALNLHNGTLYKWNRLCYGLKDNVAHLRIENRYIPAGPSVKDEIANAMFWVGVMQGMPDTYRQIWNQMPFKDARGNFINAARTGINTYFNWFGRGISAVKLARTILIPMAREGLKKSKVNLKDIDFYMNIIEKRLDNNITGSQWQIRNFRKLKEGMSNEEAAIILTHNMHKNQVKKLPVYQWEQATVTKRKSLNSRDKVYKVMTKELYVVNEHDLVDLLSKIMLWKQIHHLPVVDKANRIKGIITRTNLDAHHLKNNKLKKIIAKDIMIKDVIVGQPEMFIDEAKKIMIQHNIGCLPIIENKELIGMLTKNDLFKKNQKTI